MQSGNANSEGVVDHSVVTGDIQHDASGGNRLFLYNLSGLNTRLFRGMHQV